MKKLKRILAVILIIIAAVSVFACNENDSEGSVTVVIGTETPTEYTVDLSKVDGKNGLVAVLEYLKSEENLQFEMQGTMIDRVGDLKNDSSTGTYVYIYTSVAADQDVSEYKETVEFNGQILTSTGVGAAQMSIVDGAVIYIGTIVWN